MRDIAHPGVVKQGGDKGEQSTHPYPSQATFSLVGIAHRYANSKTCGPPGGEVLEVYSVSQPLGRKGGGLGLERGGV